ncbi:PIR protein CIR protein [Plasmodium vinckei brucechwatti]|uniref:PIR protein CIR protein n=1 Tax=Plasmodium vinckei brucechwatti TaxID=119398 RepID=A0A6V7RYB8_PLAVN|nr:PIR protein CIR protein [Plasmodium vinckei brucechwatti]
MDDKACDLLSEVDDLFTRGIINEKKFNNFNKCHSYCPRQNKCTNEYERINALGSYLFTKISEIDENYKRQYGVSQNIELFMIWLGGILFKMDNDYKATLEESYKKHLENHVGNFNYWDVINSKSIYKDATIRKMSELYILLSNICKLINEYNKNTKKPDSKRLGNYSTQCINSYRSFYTSASGCKPYLRLLDSLKMMYEIFRSQKIVNNNLQGREKTLLLNRIKHLTMFKDENQLFVSVNEKLSFDDKECIGVKSKDEKIGEQILQNKPKGTKLTKKNDIGPQKKFPPSVSQGKKTLPAPAKPPKAPSPQPSPQSKLKQETKQQQASQPVAPIQPPNPQPPVSSQKPGTPLPPPAPPLTSSQKDTQLKTPKAGEIHQNRPVGPGDGKGSGAHGSGGVGIRSGDQTVKGSQEGIGGGQGSQSSGASGRQGSQGITSSESGGSSGGAGEGKGDAGNGGSSAQGDQGKSTGGTGSVQGGQAKGSGDLSHGNPAPAPSGTGTTPSSHPVQLPTGSQSSPVSPPVPPPVPSPVPSTPQVPTPPGTTPSPQSVQQQSGSPPTIPPQSLDQQKQKPEGQPSSQNDPSLPTPQTGGSNDSKEPKDSGNDKGNTGGTNDNTGDPNGGSKDPGDGSSDPASNTSGGSFNLGSSLFGFLFNGAENLKKTSEFIKDNQQKFKDAAEKISGAYNKAKDNLKNAYNVSNDYLNKYVSNIIDQLSQFDPPPKSDGSQTGPSNPPGGGNSNNQLQSPQPPSATDTTDPSKGPSSNSQQNIPPNPTLNPPTPSNPIQQKQSFSQPQPTTHQNPQAPAQVNQSNSQKIGQLVKSLSSDIILKKPWNIFPTTWNGSGDCKPEIKFMNTTLVCCTSEQCSLTGILITLVLIPIILLIAYKYLSFGSSKKSEKKSMKRVINFHDGNRKTKIIISSNDRNKDLKPVINSIGGKKDPLLNIYKLIRADPMPFINLFFLLIFFVYKRKRDTIE